MWCEALAFCGCGVCRYRAIWGDREPDQHGFSTLRAWRSQWSPDDTNAHGEKCAAYISVPMLAIEHSADDVVPQPHTHCIFQACASTDKTMRYIQGATHYFSGQPELLAQDAGTCIHWMRERQRAGKQHARAAPGMPL